jgi:antitoxin (DNA-binding transcriptional repressor) of toxin-antitoxin stability system
MNSMATFHISDADAARDFAALLARVRMGEAIIIESGKNPVAVIHPLAPVRRSISESIALAEKGSTELGYSPAIDADFAADLREIVSKRKPRDTSAWN